MSKFLSEGNSCQPSVRGENSKIAKNLSCIQWTWPPTPWYTNWRNRALERYLEAWHSLVLLRWRAETLHFHVPRTDEDRNSSAMWHSSSSYLLTSSLSSWGIFNPKIYIADFGPFYRAFNRDFRKKLRYKLPKQRWGQRRFGIFPERHPFW